jgi:hypothetical protein
MIKDHGPLGGASQGKAGDIDVAIAEDGPPSRGGGGAKL